MNEALREAQAHIFILESNLINKRIQLRIASIAGLVAVALPVLDSLIENKDI